MKCSINRNLLLSNSNLLALNIFKTNLLQCYTLKRSISSSILHNDNRYTSDSSVYVSSALSVCIANFSTSGQKKPP